MATVALETGPAEKTYQYLKGKNIKDFPKTNEEWLLEMESNPDAADRTYSYLAGQKIKGFPTDRAQWLQAIGVKKKVSGEGLGVGGAGILEAERQAEITEQKEEIEREKTTVEEPTPEDIATEGIAEILKPQEEPEPAKPPVEAPKLFLQEEFEEERKAQIQELLKNEPLTDEEKKSIEEGGRPDIKSFMGKRPLSNEEIFELNRIVATDPSALQGEVPTEQDGTPVMEPTEKKLWDQAAKKLETKEKRASLIETAKKQLASIETQLSEKEPVGEPVLGHAPSAPGTVELETSKRLLENIINMAGDDSGAFMAFMKGMGSVGRHLIPVVGSFGELSENMRLEQIANKPAEERTEDETTLLNTVGLINTMSAEGIKGENAYQYGQAFGMMVPYIGEFVITTPGYTAGKAVTKKAMLTTLSKVGVPKAVATGISKVAGFGTGTLAQATLNPQRIMAETERRRTPQMAAVVDLDQKEIDSLVTLKEGEGFGEAFVKAYGTTWSEFMTERFGEVLGMGSKAFKNSKVGKKLLETGAFEKMTLAQFLKIKGVKTPYTADVIKKATGRAGWHGVITEVWGEELPNMIINAAITGDMPVEEAMNPVSQELLDMVVPAMVMSGAFYSPVALEQVAASYEQARFKKTEEFKKWEESYREAVEKGFIEEPLEAFERRMREMVGKPTEEVAEEKPVEKEPKEVPVEKAVPKPTEELKKEPVEPVAKAPAPSVEGPKGEVKIGIPPQEAPSPPKYKRVYKNEATLTGKEKISLQKDNIEKSTYEPTSGALLEKEVNRMYNENERQEVENQIMDLSNDMTVPLRRRAASFTAVKYMEEGNDAEFVKFNRLARSLRTEAGKTLALSQFENQGVEAATEIIASAIETNEQALEEKGVKGKTVRENITEDYEKVRGLAAKVGVEVSENETLHSIIDKIVSKVTPRKTTKQRIAKAKSTRQKLTKEYKNRKKDLFTAAVIPGVTPEGVEYIRKVAATYVDEGIARIEELTKKVADHIKKEFGVNVDPKKLEKTLGEVAGERLLKGYRKEISEIIKTHYSKEGAKEDLTERIVQELGVDEKAAKEISSHIGEAFDKAVREESEKFLGKALARPKTREKAGVKTETDRMVEALNAGALDQQQYQQMFSEKYGLKSLDSGDIKALKEHLDAIATAKSDFEKRDLTYELMLELLRMDIADKHWLGQLWNGFLGTWYMNILSGPGTHALNTFANLAETISELFIMIGKDPQRTDVYFSALARGMVRTGLVEALNTMMKGVPIAKAHKLEMPTEVEAVKMMDPKKILDRDAISTIGNVLRALNALRVGVMRLASTRLLSAVDAVFFSGLKELKAADLAYSIAAFEKQKKGKVKIKGLGIQDLKTQIKPNESVRQRARYIMNMSRATDKENRISDIQEAKQKATKEGYTGIPFIRKVNEIIDKKRAETSEDILFISRDFASRGTFNYPPEGVVGVFSRGMAQVGDMFTPFKSVVPFTRVIANVMNRYLDYTPYGMLRATGFNVGRVYDKVNNTKDAMKLYRHDLTEEEKIDLAMKASMGTIMMLLAYMFAGDEEEDLFEVTADGTGDLYKNFDLAESGWQEFSVKIGGVWYSYKNTPLGVGMAVIGYMKDREKYKKGTGEENIALIASSMSAYMMDMSFLNGMEEFLKLLTADKRGKDPSKAWERWWANKAKGVVIPNAWTQTYRAYQEHNDMPMKEAKEFWHYFIRDIPYVRDRLGIIYNSWGEPVVADQIKRFLPLTPKVVGKRDPVIWAANIDAKKFINTPSQPHWIENENTYTDYKVLRAQNIYDLLKNDELYKGTPLYETLGLFGKKGGTMEEYKEGKYGKEIQRFLKSNPKAETKEVHAFMSEIVDDEWRSVVSDAGTAADNELYFKEHPDEGTYKRKRWQREK